VVQQQSLVTPNEVQKELQSGGDTAAQTAELVAQTREMQLKSIDEARARIFGHVIGDGERSAHKVLRRKLIGQKIVSWYPTPIQKQDPMFEDPKIKRRAVKNERLKRRGKGPPKKGHGKRAAKRAK
jgi:small subunit ribosomal protein S33